MTIHAWEPLPPQLERVVRERACTMRGWKMSHCPKSIPATIIPTVAFEFPSMIRSGWHLGGSIQQLFASKCVGQKCCILWHHWSLGILQESLHLCSRTFHSIAWIQVRSKPQICHLTIKESNTTRFMVMSLLVMEQHYSFMNGVRKLLNRAKTQRASQVVATVLPMSVMYWNTFLFPFERYMQQRGHFTLEQGTKKCALLRPQRKISRRRKSIVSHVLIARARALSEQKTLWQNNRGFYTAKSPRCWDALLKNFSWRYHRSTFRTYIPDISSTTKHIHPFLRTCCIRCGSVYEKWWSHWTGRVLNFGTRNIY